MISSPLTDNPRSLLEVTSAADYFARVSEVVRQIETALDVAFDLKRLMRTRYKIDSFQSTYFVIDAFEQLFDATAPDFARRTLSTSAFHSAARYSASTVGAEYLAALVVEPLYPA